MIQRIQFLIEDAKAWWEEQMWLASPERKELASMRLAAHKKAVKEGYDSPYVNPDNYNANWEPIYKVVKTKDQ